MPNNKITKAKEDSCWVRLQYRGNYTDAKNIHVFRRKNFNFFVIEAIKGMDIEIDL